MNKQLETATETASSLRQDLMVLMKFRLNVFVLITAIMGFLLASKGQVMDGWRLFHLIIGTAAVAFGSAAFNQLMEIDLDAKMERTKNRPLPSKRMTTLFAFSFAWILSAWGLLNLYVKVNPMSAYFAAATLTSYIFLYTPVKQISSINTLLGAIPGAIPPVIGWVGAGKVLNWESFFLFALMFFWQLPHFIAINWLCREEYEAARYRMWSNGDLSGKKSGLLAMMFSFLLLCTSLVPWLLGFASLVWLVGGVLLAGLMTWLAWVFYQKGSRAHARRLFFFTLLYLPLVFILLWLTWLT